jgi:hypothetical protein
VAQPPYNSCGNPPANSALSMWPNHNYIRPVGLKPTMVVVVMMVLIAPFFLEDHRSPKAPSSISPPKHWGHHIVIVYTPSAKAKQTPNKRKAHKQQKQKKQKEKHNLCSFLCKELFKIISHSREVNVVSATESNLDLTNGHGRRITSPSLVVDTFECSEFHDDAQQWS